MMPQNARSGICVVEQRVLDLSEYAEDCPFNRVEMGDTRVGIITSGATYVYAREAVAGRQLPEDGHALSAAQKLIADFRSKVDKLYVVEESDPFMEEAIRLMGIKIDGGKELNTLQGELNARCGRVAGEGRRHRVWTRVCSAICARQLADLPDRPPTFCPGCSHRGVYRDLEQAQGVRVAATSAATPWARLPPYNALHCQTCMGASISMAHGMAKVMDPPAEGAKPDLRNKVVGSHRRQHVLPLRHHLPHGRGLQQRATPSPHRRQRHHGHDRRPGEPRHRQDPAGRAPAAVVDIPALCKALGIKRVTHMDPYDLKDVERVLREELAADEASVVIAKAPCVLQFKVRKPVYQVDPELCTGCKHCLKAGCGALNLYADAERRPQGGDQRCRLRRLRRLLADVQVRRHQPTRA